MAEEVNKPYKVELIDSQLLGAGLAEVEFATMDRAQWRNTKRFHQHLRYRTPVEVEAEHYDYH